MRREFFLQDDVSNKFWTVELNESTVRTTYGRVGAQPRETSRTFPDPARARREVDRLVASKVGKGYREGSLASIPEHRKTDWSQVTMSEEVFWRLIRLLNWKKTGDDDAVVEPLVAALAQMTEEDICRFEDLLAAKLHALDTEAHAREIGAEAYRPGQHFSADWFLYQRCVVVANGPELYQRVLSSPQEMPKDMEFEALLSVAATAFERKTGRDFDHVAPVSYETFSNTAGWGGRSE